MDIEHPTLEPCLRAASKKSDCVQIMARCALKVMSWQTMVTSEKRSSIKSPPTALQSREEFPIDAILKNKREMAGKRDMGERDGWEETDGKER